MPRRIQFRGRQPGWTMPAGAIYVGRHRGVVYGRFGNPFTMTAVLERHLASTVQDAAQVVVEQHRHWLSGDPAFDDVVELRGRAYDRRVVRAALPDLVGHDLACWCRLPAPGRPDLCHATTLLAAAAAIASAPPAFPGITPALLATGPSPLLEGRILTP